MKVVIAFIALAAFVAAYPLEDFNDGYYNEDEFIQFGIFDKFGDAVRNAVDKTKESVKNAADKIKQGAKDAADKIKQGAKDAVEKIKNGAKDVDDKVKDAAGKVKDGAEGVGEQIKKEAEHVRYEAQKGAQKVGEGIQNGIGKLKEEVEKIKTVVEKTIESKCTRTGCNVCAKLSNGNVCVGGSVDFSTLSFSGNIQYNGNVIMKQAFSANDPPQMCLAVPKVELISFCADFYGMSVKDHKGSGCLRFVFKVAGMEVAPVDVGCTNFEL